MNIDLDNNKINQVEIINNREKQQKFLETNIGQAVNSAIDIGLKTLLPNVIEDQIINIKDAIIENGLEGGIKEVVDMGEETGKSIYGIITGNFESISQMQLAIKKGGIIDKLSDILDFSISFAHQKGIINNNEANLIKNGKNFIISSISNNLEETLVNQIKSIEKIEKNCENWKSAYGNQDLIGMEKEYKKIKKELNKIMPLENIINNARKIENLNNLIKNKGNNFELTAEEIRLAEIL